MKTAQLIKEKTVDKQIVEMADAHCHLDIIEDPQIIRDAVSFGVRTIITNGVDIKSNIKNLQLADNKNIFAIVGIDPEHADVTDDELDFSINLAKHNRNKIVGIGEIGLDKKINNVSFERQNLVFERFLDLANDLGLPVSIHSRGALEEVLHLLSEKNMKAAHIHFFEGSVQQAKAVEKKGYMISIPPLQSGRRSKVIKEIAIDNIMAESDAPVVGFSPKEVERSIGIVAEAKRIEFKKAADLLTQNTKRFFRIKTKETLMRF